MTWYEKSYKRLYKYRDKVSTRYGVSLPLNPLFVGKGSMGVAYNIGNGLVLKVTDDDIEGEASYLLSNKRTKYINHIYASFVVMKKPELLPEYFIIQDMLPGKINNKETEAVKFIMYLEWNFDTLDELNTLYKEIANNKPLSPGRASNYYEKAIKPHSKYNHKYFIKMLGFYVNAMNELRKYGIDYGDFRPNNVMKDKDGNYKIIDVGGGSNIKNHGIIDIIESKINEVKKTKTP